MSDESEREAALFAAGKIAGEPAYDWSENKKNLRAEFEARFTLVEIGCPNILDDGCIEGANGLWDWIMENFVPREDRK